MSNFCYGTGAEAQAVQIANTDCYATENRIIKDIIYPMPAELIVSSPVNAFQINKGVAKRAKVINNHVNGMALFNGGWLETEGVVIDQTPFITQDSDYNGAPPYPVPVGFRYYNKTTKKLMVVNIDGVYDVAGNKLSQG